MHHTYTTETICSLYTDWILQLIPKNLDIQLTTMLLTSRDRKTFQFSGNVQIWQQISAVFVIGYLGYNVVYQYYITSDNSYQIIMKSSCHGKPITWLSNMANNRQIIQSYHERSTAILKTVTETGNTVVCQHAHCWYTTCSRHWTKFCQVIADNGIG